MVCKNSRQFDDINKGGKDDFVLLKLKEVINIVKISKTSIYGWMAKDEFPKPIKIGNLSRWVNVEVYQWLSNKLVQREK